jgi:hypothetical protein
LGKFSQGQSGIFSLFQRGISSKYFEKIHNRNDYNDNSMIILDCDY